MQPGVRSGGAGLQPQKPQSPPQSWHPGLLAAPVHPSPATNASGNYDNSENSALTFAAGGLLPAQSTQAEFETLPWAQRESRSTQVPRGDYPGTLAKSVMAASSSSALAGRQFAPIYGCRVLIVPRVLKDFPKADWPTQSSGSNP